jgi:hypothetical protein
MANNSYAQLIDDFEAGLLVIEGESLTDYIKRMGGVDYESKANGGIMGYAEGGLMSPEEYFKGKEKYMKEEQIENMRREYNEYLYKQNHGPRDEAANGGIMGYAIGGNIINQDINKYQNIDNQRAEVLQQDINASKGKGFKAQDLDTLKSIEFVNPTLTEFELQGLKDGSITKPGSYSKPQARLTNEEYLNNNPNLTASLNNIAKDFTYNTKTSNFNDSYNYNDVDAMTADEQAQLPFDRIAPQRNIFEKAMDYIPFVGNKSLSGMAVRGAGNMIKGIGNFFQGDPRQQARNADNKQFGVGDIYGYGMGSPSLPNQDAFGYNTVSRFGDYEQHMIDTVEKLENLLTKTNRTGFKPGTPNFNKLKDYSKNIAVINEKARIADLAEKERFNRILNNTTNTGGGGGGDSRMTKAFGKNAMMGDPAQFFSDNDSGGGGGESFGGSGQETQANMYAYGGRAGYRDGGLASMFKQKR